MAGDTERPAQSGAQPVSGGPPAPPPDEPSVVGAEFEKMAAQANADARPAVPPAEPEEGDDDWYVRTGQPAPNRDDPEAADAEVPDGAAVKYGGLAVAVVLVLVALIVLFGVFLP